MKSVKYRIRLLGMKSPEGTIPLIALKEISESILNGSEKALRLSIEGESTRRGRIPEWIKRSLELTVTGISKGSTILEVEAPILVESATDQVQQQDLWYSKPDPEDTAISLLSKSVFDATSGNVDSRNYDQGVLTSLATFTPVFESYLEQIEITSLDRPKDSLILEYADMIKINNLKSAIHEPQAIVVSGLFDIIEHSERRFRLVQENGHKIEGKVESQYVTEDDMRSFWGKKVTVRGTAYFSPSGRVRIIDAKIIKLFEPGEQVFESISEILTPMKRDENLDMRLPQKNLLREIWGKWPGDESIEDLLSTLRDLSREN